ncbi:unnamed protein product [Mycena citricolor]|uniref:5'-3' exoribonuclease n=1 Tax=Mycena citricolor TaxID=2018698 RepID=A0AAD2GU17_9AGAR|nr:unnamed protein product [Mycena citricolor]
MGVPALFRWLSRKYPKIIYPVVEEEEIRVPGDGEVLSIPVNMSMANPNGKEFDNLYLDMNGIVHPCTHPDGKAAPLTEEDMMIEIFKYTERVVNMVRPRKILFMAIDGVAPRAKMNQQRSRRFRAAQEAKDKAAAQEEANALWRAMGKTVEENNREAWDTNAITPGTPFMELLAASLRFWVVHKINTDPGWKNLEVLISDAGVPGEGEHKIMDWIRRQRVSPGHDPNTKHVIYGLDADLIMLGIATHEPNFWVLREDVFMDGASSTACRKCGQEGHYAAQCMLTQEQIKQSKKAISDEEAAIKKPFIFLDIAILREYLVVELDVPEIPFKFDFEMAVDDWVLLIFFVGNDFLPHLPSLEIREGAIDTLLTIWKTELPRMGGYLTDHGEIVLERAQIILDGLAQREDDIFRRRREAENRQDSNAKRRKLEGGMKNDIRPSSSLALTSGPTAPVQHHHSLPPRPNFAANADALGFGTAAVSSSTSPAAAEPSPPSSSAAAADTATAIQALAGSNRDVVANRRAIRMANMSAAEMLKAEMASAVPVKPSAHSSLPAKPPPPVTPLAPPSMPPPSESPAADVDMSDVATTYSATSTHLSTTSADSLAGSKRKLSEVNESEQDAVGEDEEDASAPANVSAPKKLIVNPDGTVEQEDVVKLWEPGYKDRYYAQKFPDAVLESDFKRKITTAYVEGLCWVLKYYYQGAPSWQWFYPYHFAPFAADFENVKDMDIRFQLGMPFKPFEQLMGVFPAASRKHIPEIFHQLMLDERSPLRGGDKENEKLSPDFYPEEFEIDMNGKKMAWQGVALLSFIDQDVLLSSMAQPFAFLPADERPALTAQEMELAKNEPPYTVFLSEGERRRNAWGKNVMFAADEHPVYPVFESLYGKRKTQDVGHVSDLVCSYLISSHLSLATARRAGPEAEQRHLGQHRAQPRLSSRLYVPQRQQPPGNGGRAERPVAVGGVLLPETGHAAPQRSAPGGGQAAARAHGDRPGDGAEGSGGAGAGEGRAAK